MVDYIFFIVAVLGLVLFGSLIGSLVIACRIAIVKYAKKRHLRRVQECGPSVVAFRKSRRPIERRRKARPDRNIVVSFLLIGTAVALAVFFEIADSGRLHGSTLEGNVTRVRDGDTIVVGRTPIRFAKLDCAEMGTKQGSIARQRMVELAAGQRVTCTLHGRKSYDREIGECRLSDGRDLSSIMIGERVCRRWW
ncbi:thermonuclease family protein [Ruegeria arenilitoris]|uniref:thermonuclease family protein n=1 Tax=Ruegeria arenilitoris TaxID=1173585 RepID=UPI0014813D10|nr:hypothetical protein [Ruegeria arenilitoris]